MGWKNSPLWRFGLGHQFQVECPSGLVKAFHSCWQCQSNVLWTTLKETHVLRKAGVPLNVFKHANPEGITSDWDFSLTDIRSLRGKKRQKKAPLPPPPKKDHQKNPQKHPPKKPHPQPFPISYSKEYKILIKGQKVAWPTILSSNFYRARQ